MVANDANKYQQLKNAEKAAQLADKQREEALKKAVAKKLSELKSHDLLSQKHLLEIQRVQD